MAVVKDFATSRGIDASFVLPVAPPAPIGGMNLRFSVAKRFDGGASGLLTKSMASGFYGTSGMNIQNSGAGVMTVTINAVDTSGWDFGNYAYRVERLDSGLAGVLAVGYWQLGP